MRVDALRLRDFRCYAAAELALGPGLTVIHGPNGAGKTNLLEALYFGCTARSCRTSNEREMVRFGSTATRVVVHGADAAGAHELTAGFSPGEPKRLTADGAPVERLLDTSFRPLFGVFLPERLELIKGPPALRRAHLDQLVTGLWPARSATRRGYAQALAQRNALLSRVRQGRAAREALRGWDLKLAELGVALSEDRARATDLLAEPFALQSEALGLTGAAVLEYRPRSRAPTPEQLADEFAARLDTDLERGFTTHGPHRDELRLSRDGRELRAYGSQGEQRLALLAVLLAERRVIADVRDRPPLMLLDDVMSELDSSRRENLVRELQRGGQAVITTTDAEHVPGAGGEDVARIAVTHGEILDQALVA
ncbi:MAG: DNA replication/repair protein RecF [Solirubrobacteraceae bacterium]